MIKWLFSLLVWLAITCELCDAHLDEYWNVENGDLVRQIDFDGLLALEKSNQEFFVYIYMNECGVCEHVKPLVLSALAKFKEETKNEFVIYAIDNERFGHRIAAETNYWKPQEGVPFFGMFKGGKKLFEIDPRTEKEFLRFFQNPTAPFRPPAEPEWSSFESSKDINFVDDSSFDDFLKNNNKIFMIVYKSHCGACKAAKPAFEEIATKLAAENHEMKLAAVSMTSGDKILKKFGVTKFPTFLYFSDGNFEFEYFGGRKADKIEEFCRNPVFIERPKADLGFTVETNVTILDDNADSFLSKNEAVLVMVHTAWCGHCKTMKPDFIRVSDELAASNSAARLAAIEGDKFRNWLEPFDVSGFPTLLYFEKGEYKFKYTGGRTKAAILKFMKNPVQETPKPQIDEILESLPESIPKLTKETFDDFVEENAAAIVYFYAPWCGVCKSAKTQFYEAQEMAEEEDLNVKFAVFNADPKSDDPAEMLFAKEFGIKKYPTIWFFEEAEQKYKFNAQNDLDSFLRFAREPEKRGRVNTLEGDPAWLSPDGEMHIEILSDESYAEFVAENEEAMIFWVAEGCIRCFEIVQPEFVILAQTLAEIKPTFKLAIIDGSEFKDFAKEKKIDSYPRLEYFKRGRFQYLYENQHNGQAMLNFALQPTKEQAQRPKRYIWELDSSRDSGSVIHVSKFTFPEEVEKVKFGFLMLHAGGYDGAGSMTNVYDAFAEASKVLASIAELKLYACDCGRGKDWGKLCHTEGIHRWPDFRFIVDGQSEDEFDGGNFETADFVNFVKSKLPSSKDEL